MAFSEQIKQWVSLDNQLKTLNERVKVLRSERNTITEDIIEYVDTNKLTNAVVKISDGKLRFTETTQHSPLTFKYIEVCLNKCIDNQEDVKNIMKVIKESRQSKSVSDIKRTYMDTSTN
jgi:hypothetical protein